MSRDDTISRQAAIDAVQKAVKNIDSMNKADIVAVISNLPSAQSDRKTSEWLHEYLQTAVDFGIITETQASRLMDMINDSEDNT